MRKIIIIITSSQRLLMFFVDFFFSQNDFSKRYVCFKLHNLKHLSLILCICVCCFVSVALKLFFSLHLIFHLLIHWITSPRGVFDWLRGSACSFVHSASRRDKALICLCQTKVNPLLHVPTKV